MRKCIVRFVTRNMKKKYKIKINNKLKGDYGTEENGKIEINLKAHYKKGKLDRKELASTVKHEIMHAKHPKMTEKQVYKKTQKTKIPFSEQQKLISKLRNKKLNYKIGSMKRSLGMKKNKVEPGTFISKVNENKQITRTKQPISKERLAVLGLV